MIEKAKLGGHLGVLKVVNGSQLAKMKKSIPDMSLPEIYTDETVGLKSCRYTLKITIYVIREYVEFGEIS